MLAENCSYLEVAFLLVYGELPTFERLQIWEKRIKEHSTISNDIINMISTFNADANPTGMFISAMAAIGTYFPEQNPALVG
jgi:citrate synthase